MTHDIISFNELNMCDKFMWHLIENMDVEAFVTNKI